LLSGHHHRALSGGIAEVGGKGSVIVLHAGTAVSRRTRGAEGNSYNLIEVAERHVSVHVMECTAGQGSRENRALSYLLQDEKWRSDERSAAPGMPGVPKGSPMPDR